MRAAGRVESDPRWVRDGQEIQFVVCSSTVLTAVISKGNVIVGPMTQNQFGNGRKMATLPAKRQSQGCPKSLRPGLCEIMVSRLDIGGRGDFFRCFLKVTLFDICLSTF
jgi:hypothetical protein